MANKYIIVRADSGRRKFNKATPKHGWSGKQKADYLEKQFERVCAGELSMEAYKQLKKEVMRI